MQGKREKRIWSKAMNNNIILIGFMGVGKGTIARELVRQSEMVAIDTDDLIESMENRAIKKIFDKEGEKYFRSLEKKISIWLEKSVKNSIISTGGGFYNVKNLNSIGTVIYLHASYEGIIKRISEHPKAKQKFAKRPLLQDAKAAKKLYASRKPIYKEKADIIIHVEGKKPQNIAKEILQKINS